MTWLLAYLIFGCGAYCGVACARLHSFKKATTLQTLRGWLFGVLLSPVALAIVFYQEYKKRNP